MTNDQLLSFLFQGLAEDERAVVCSFRADPLEHSSWRSSAWSPGRPWDPLNNNFAAVSSFRPDSAGNWRCKAPAFSELRLVMLDDVAHPGSLPVAPTYVIETSPGNHQVGYALRRAGELRDRRNASRFLTEIGRAAGNLGGTNVTRWARLPEGTNTKMRYGPAGFSHRLVDFSPVLHDWRTVAEACGARVGALCAHILPAPLTNAALDYVVPSLRAMGMYKRELGHGRHAVVCPNREEHTRGEQGQSDSVFFEPSAENGGRGGFKCLHSHCQHVDLALLLGVIDAFQQLAGAVGVVEADGAVKK